LELLVVLMIIGLLAGLVAPRLFEKVDSSMAKTAEAQVKMIKSALQTFRLDVGRYPTSAEGLRSLNVAPEEEIAARKWRGPYLDEDLPPDPWGNPYQYRAEPSGSQPFSLFSLGADGQVGGEELAADIGYLPDQR
jgi:general secretion pathway protein G